MARRTPDDGTEFRADFGGTTDSAIAYEALIKPWIPAFAGMTV